VWERATGGRLCLIKEKRKNGLEDLPLFNLQSEEKEKAKKKDLRQREDPEANKNFSMSIRERGPPTSLPRKVLPNHFSKIKKWPLKKKNYNNQPHQNSGPQKRRRPLLGHGLSFFSKKTQKKRFGQQHQPPPEPCTETVRGLRRNDGGKKKPLF